ncbi:MAG TPA: hypothetical protein VNX25_03665 [Verrucomicrobiae bacterium]|nr:hypothetical protein [Verrucomicrobiae bacterium]
MRNPHRLRECRKLPVCQRGGARASWRLWLLLLDETAAGMKPQEKRCCWKWCTRSAAAV